MIFKRRHALNALIASALLLLETGTAALSPVSGIGLSHTTSAEQPSIDTVTPNVVIGEFMAAPNDVPGSDALRDEDGDVVDWIEIQNLGAGTADLSGWYLTDRVNKLDRWKFPAGTHVNPHGFLVVMASGKDRRESTLWLHTDFSLNREGEYLALVSPAGNIVSSFGPEYPVQYTGVAYGYERVPTESGGGLLPGPMYLRMATPGAANPFQVGPSIVSVRKIPDILPSQQELQVTATIARVDALASVLLHYRFDFGPEVTEVMAWHGDNNYSATIPTTTKSPGTLIRYYVTAFDPGSEYGAPESRWPLPCNRPSLPFRPPWRRTQVWLPEIVMPANGAIGDPDVIRCPAYEGTIVDPGQVQGNSNVPVLYWYIQENPVYGWEWYRAGYDAVIQSGRPAWVYQDPGASVSVFYADTLYDNVSIKLRGAGSLVFSKKGLAFGFNDDYELVLRGDEGGIVNDYGSRRFDTINIATTGEDESYVRQPIGYQTYRETRNPAPLSFPIRLELNGRFFSIASFVEETDGDFLARNHLDPAGALFKMDNNALALAGISDLAAGAVQRRPNWIDRRKALRNLILGLNQHLTDPREGRAKTTGYVFDNVNVPELINYMATRTLLDDFDTLWHNYDLYQDLAAIPGENDARLWPGTGEWSIIPQDKDHVLFDGWTYPVGAGHPYYGAVGYTDRPNGLVDAVIQSDNLRAMYLRRLRTLIDQQFAVSGGSWLTDHTLMLLAEIGPEALLDSIHWTGSSVAPTDKPIASFNPHVLPLRIEQRRHQLQDAGPDTYGALLPPSQSEEDIHFGHYEIGQRLNNTAITLINCGKEATDITDWVLSGGGGLTYTFSPGTVISGNGGTLYVTPDVRNFRTYQRWASSAEILGLFVQGGFASDLIGDWRTGAYIPAPMMLRNSARVVTDNATLGQCSKVFLPRLMAQ